MRIIVGASLGKKQLVVSTNCGQICQVRSNSNRFGPVSEVGKVFFHYMDLLSISEMLPNTITNIIFGVNQQLERRHWGFV